MTFITQRAILVNTIINRNIFNKLKIEITEPEINILLGPRQVGKTTLLLQLEEYCKKQKLKTCFYDLEQPQVLAQFNRSEAELIELLTQSGEIIFVDEFHYLQNASKIFKAIYDSKKLTFQSCKIEFLTFEDFIQSKDLISGA